MLIILYIFFFSILDVYLGLNGVCFDILQVYEYVPKAPRL